MDPSGKRGVVERAHYLIDRFPVAYAFGGGWTCSCADFIATDACRHTREAAGRYAAQTRIREHIKLGSRATLAFRERQPILIHRPVAEESPAAPVPVRTTRVSTNEPRALGH